MKTSYLVLTGTLGVCLTALAQPAAQPAAKPVAVNAPEKKLIATDLPVPKSSFGIPAKPQEGHDPFFPSSDRLFAVKAAPRSTPGAVNASIVFNGISGSEDRRLAMINGHTVAEGEKASFNTPSGRVSVLLVAIKGDVAVVEIGGERRELKFQGQ